MGNTGSTSWITRAETRADIPVIREITLAAFGRAHEADIVDKLRADESAWIEGLSLVVTEPEAADDTTGAALLGHILLTRGHIGDTPALCLGPVSVRPERQRDGVGSVAMRAALAAAAARGERYVVLVGHPEYYPRFGFTRASAYGIRLSVEVPDDALMALALDEAHPLPGGMIRWPAAFGI
ncbi:GNAT family N-acetyltransferase [Streptomyces sp. WAC 06738]|uniref:GNAT family N-acetyltransferase n=1 Tax=Streptomyces sp. WAC 06738 TaxID=2203210 RepID=UPI000F6E4D75|nr:N-acetyltransferase [Streptomyces sp. WAC 06738]AZM50876.1 GNAT family N-acetyltransferase [Streptomyces sp. WAC 06738]